MAYSKSAVDRAGRLFSDGWSCVLRGEPVPKDWREQFFEAHEIVSWWRSQHARPLSRVAANLRYYAAQEGKPVVAQRLKKVGTIGEKLQREPTMKLSRMADIGGVRAVFVGQEAASRVAAKLRRNWTITKFRDYVLEPKEDGYRALHLISQYRGRRIEIQLRTTNQDLWANDVEESSRLLAPGLKYGEGPETLKVYYLALAASYARIDQRIPPDPAFSKRLFLALNGRSTLEEFKNAP